MDAFEQLIATLLKHKGFWTYQNYKINLTKEEKREIGKHSLPRPDIDILAYHAASNTLVWFECKSLLDSGGLRYKDLINPSGTLKMFADANYRNITTKRLIAQVVDEGLTRPQPTVRYGIIAGNIYKIDREQFKDYCEQHDWYLYDRDWIRETIAEFADMSYTNDPLVMLAKLLLRN